jgi:hypothetical protein
MDNALNKIPGAVAIVDARIDVRRLNFLLFQVETYVISGTALIDSNLALSDGDGNKQYLVMDTQDGIDFSSRYITEDEYHQYLASVN